MTLTKKASLPAVEVTPKNNLQQQQRRILFLSLEFNYSPFSGNGVLCRSLVSGLLAENNLENNQHDVEIRVICAKPHPSIPNLSSDIDTIVGKNLEIWAVELPPPPPHTSSNESSSSNKYHPQWKRLDRFSYWNEFATICGSSELFQNRIEQFEPTDVVAIDWHGMLAWQAILTNNNHRNSHGWKKDVTVCYYNFRVYSSSSWGDTDNNNDINDHNNNDSTNQFYKEMEQLSCHLADGIICLSKHDQVALQKLMMTQQQQDEDTNNPSSSSSSSTTTFCCQEKKQNKKKLQEITILPPPLRGDVSKLARMIELQEGVTMTPPSLLEQYLPKEVKAALHHVLSSHHLHHHHGKLLPPQQQRRIFLTCISRLSPEKSPHIFVNLLHQYGGIHFLKRHGLVPILCGAKSVQSYADRVIQSFQEVCCPSSTTLSTDDSDDEDDSFYWPCIVIDHHLGPKELAAIFSYTALNIHPCLYDAYGMTMVESAAFGVPSVVNCGGNVGAASLLGENEGCIALNLSEMEEVIVQTMTMTDDRKNDSSSNEKEEEEEADCVKKLMELLASRRIMHAAIDTDRPQQQSCCSTTTTLAKVAKEARRRALEYDELSCCRSLIDKLNSLKEN